MANAPGWVRSFFFFVLDLFLNSVDVLLVHTRYPTVVTQT